MVPPPGGGRVGTRAADAPPALGAGPPERRARRHCYSVQWLVTLADSTAPTAQRRRVAIVSRLTLRCGWRRQTEGWGWWPGGPVHYRHRRRGQGILRGRGGPRGSSIATLVGANATAGRTVSASGAAVLGGSATIADNPTVLPAIREQAAHLAAADGLDAKVVLARDPGSRAEAGALKLSATAVADGPAVLLPRRLVTRIGHAFRAAQASAVRAKPAGERAIPAAQRATAAIGNIAAPSFRRCLARARLACRGPPDADMILADPALLTTIRPAVQGSPAAVADIATVPAGYPVVAAERDAIIVGRAPPVGLAHLPHGAAISAVEDAAAAVSDLAAVVEGAIGIVTGEGDTSVRAGSGIGAADLGQAGFGGQVSGLDGDVARLGDGILSLGD